MQETQVQPWSGKTPHMPWSNEAHVQQLLNLSSRVRQLQLLTLCDAGFTPLKPTCPRARAPQEKSPQWEACTLQQSRARFPQLEKSPGCSKDMAQPKINKENKHYFKKVFNLI